MFRVLHKMGSNSKVDIVTENGDRLQRYRMAYRNRYYLNKGKGIKIYVKYYIHLLSVICNVIKNAQIKIPSIASKFILHKSEEIHHSIPSINTLINSSSNPLITPHPEERIWAGRTPRRQPRVPDAPRSTRYYVKIICT